MKTLSDFVSLFLDLTDVLLAKVGEHKFDICIRKASEAGKLELCSKEHDKASSSPFKLFRTCLPNVNTKGRGWNSITYNGHTLVWWRRQQMTSFYAKLIKNSSDKVKEVALKESATGELSFAAEVSSPADVDAVK